TRLAALEPQLDAADAEYRRIQNQMREITSPGSTAPLVQFALEEIQTDLMAYDTRNAIMDRRLRFERAMTQHETENIINQSNAEFSVTASDRLKAILGFYAIDERGEILRDGANQPILTQEYQDLLSAQGQDESTPLIEVMGGRQKGADLQVWAERIQTWSNDPQKAAMIDPEIAAALESIETALQEMIAARAFIEHREDIMIGSDPAALENVSDAKVRELDLLNTKIAYLLGFENQLTQVAEQARSAGTSPASALLEVIESPDNAYIFKLFQGYNREGEPDSIASPEIQARVDEIQTLANRLRTLRDESVITDAAAAYSDALANYALDFAEVESIYAVDPMMVPHPETIGVPQAVDFYDNIEALQSQPVHDGIDALPVNAGDPEQFRADVWDWITNADPEHRLYKSAIVSV
ncbi:MAG: hypothetical protein KDK34_09185, partial [Leptospiraceae bacterium]|nr:hypothetical protein [Leptospiraceae bacterium]